MVYRLCAGLLVLSVLPVGCLRDELVSVSSVDSRNGAVGDGLDVDLGAGDAASTDEGCRSSADCSAGKVCQLGREGCVEPVCGIGRAGQGDESQGRRCALGQGECGPNLICVSTAVTLQDGALRPAPRGLCQRACDPCASPSDCPDSYSCIQLAGGGGFCAYQGLGDVGEECRARGCRGGNTCDLTCKRVCLPHGPTAIASASASDDCPMGQVCANHGSGTDGKIVNCEFGHLVQPGFYCSPVAPTFCAAPARCDTALSLCRPVACSPGPCPEDTHCSTLWRLVETQEVCVGDGAVRAWGICGMDEDCESGLVCVPDATIPQKKTCEFTFD